MRLFILEAQMRPHLVNLVCKGFNHASGSVEETEGKEG
jgi:hypothetical protein